MSAVNLEVPDDEELQRQARLEAAMNYCNEKLSPLLPHLTEMRRATHDQGFEWAIPAGDAQNLGLLPGKLTYMGMQVFADRSLSQPAIRLATVSVSLQKQGRSDMRTPFTKAVDEVFDGARQLLLRKHNDYGPKNISLSPGGPLNGLRVRLWDKIARINNLIDTGVEPSNESLADSFVDALNYCAIGLLVLRGEWPDE